MTPRGIAWAGCTLVFWLISACGDDADNDGTSGAGGSHSAGSASSGGSSGAAQGGAGGVPQGGGGVPQGQAGADGGASMSGGMDAGAGGSEDSNPSYWRPQAGLTWQWQLSETVSAPIDVDVYDIDWEVEASIVKDLHDRGIKVICYVSVGSWEDFRPDADAFPEAVIGNDYDGWPGERYVDIRSAALREILEARFDVCRTKGFDAIEPDNMDVFELGDESGFPLTEEDGVEFALWLAEQAHARGLGIGQKNAPSITAKIVDQYDWALTESCYSDGDWCADVSAYEAANKPVFMCEYEEASFGDACEAWSDEGYSPILKNLDLDAPITFCP